MEVQSDLDHLFDFSDESIFPNHESPMSVADIEQLLFKDDEDGDGLNCDAFLHDILLDSPSDLQKSGEVVDSAAVQEKPNSDHDPLAKKRKRQLRNRDAAVRSRERKKMHVKDLEMKSRYFEGECRRLGSLLQWYMAENQALRFSLHSNSNASMTKQESAVLLLGIIPAVGFPALVNGHSGCPTQPCATTYTAPAKSKSTGNRGRRKTSTVPGSKEGR
ncbi:hypothetical protein E3N88_11669 [Mikania micrantha]|uniref:BZIP domain-containing protein n=1 Tax=Mikania micrantha TaxID=192012 RepID=A0A5N6P3D8_9ASTR|nr:hypothetical protein E3N88_11669 [Mikania micrantha]